MEIVIILWSFIDQTINWFIEIYWQLSLVAALNKSFSCLLANVHNISKGNHNMGKDAREVRPCSDIPASSFISVTSPSLWRWLQQKKKLNRPQVLQQCNAVSSRKGWHQTIKYMQVHIPNRYFRKSTTQFHCSSQSCGMDNMIHHCDEFT